MKPYADKLSKHVKNNSESHVAEQQQGDASIAQFSDNRATAVAQRQLINAINNSPKQIAQRRLLQDSFQEGLDRSQSLLTAQFKGEAKPNNFGLPDKLKAGIEGLSDYSMDDVKVHYNSAKPSQLQAHAFAQETDIHIAPGQERHLSHEAWHVVQQKQQRVKPTTQMKGGVNVNDDVELDKKADLMGEKAATQSLTQQSELNPP